ncbi:MAG: cob(I)yrinic acid a,c-diamide adenosyltransferase [Chloroflexi bacterium]|nr:cob(I)yrinic acid a,c-diamide adenosyltransferase [Chloroflexota bacterium]
MKTFNKKGDSGETSLLFGDRVAKSDPRCEAYGTIDEAVSFLGLACNFCRPEIKNIIFSLQQELFVVGAELATPDGHYARLAEKGKTVTPEMVQRLEALIEEFETKVEMPKAFIIPGGSAGSAALDVVRTVIRRAERRVVALKEAGIVKNDEILKYLNRLADLIFTLARYEDSTM